MAARSPLVLWIPLLAAAAVGWWLFGRSETKPVEDVRFDDPGRPARVGPGPATNLPGRPAGEPTYFEIAMDGATSWRDAVDKQVRLEIPVDASGELVTGGDLIDALSARMRIRFASAEDAREFRRRTAEVPDVVEDGKLKTGIDMLPVLIDRMGYLMGSNEQGELVLERPQHTLVTPEED
ncbi:MAG: hypothetical protein AB7T63_02855 [Planctomycetota bacterium]